MAVIKAGDTRRKLESKFGFKHDGGTRHDRFVLLVDDSCFAYVDLVRSKKDFGVTLIGRMAQQLGVSPNELVGMIQCTVSRADYYAKKGIPNEKDNDRTTVGIGDRSAKSNEPNPTPSASLAGKTPPRLSSG